MGSSLAVAAATGAALSASALATSGGVLAAQEVIQLPAEDRLLEAGFEELYRVGSLQGGDWDTFGRVAGASPSTTRENGRSCCSAATGNSSV